MSDPGDEDNRFIRALFRVIERFPYKSVTLVIAAIGLFVGLGWGAAMIFRPPLAGELQAVRQAFRSNNLTVPEQNDVVFLIDQLSVEMKRKIGAAATSPPPEILNPANDISGSWNYKCIALDRKYSHGGTAVIDMKMTPYGPRWRLSGTRTWRQIDGKYEDGINYPWHTDWAAITGKDRIKYTYNIATDKGNVLGFADGSVTRRNEEGKPSTIEGNFYQLPPLDAMYGHYEFSR